MQTPTNPFLSRRRLLGLGATALAVAALPRALRADDAAMPVVLLLLSDRSERTQAMAKSFKEGLTGCLRMSYDLTDEPDAAAYIADQLRGMEVAVVFSIGDKAAGSAVREFASTPVVVADASLAGLSASNLHSLSGRVDPELTLRRLIEVAGGPRRIGLLTDGVGADRWFEAAKAAAAALKVTLDVTAFGASSEILNAFKGLATPSDLVWLLPSQRWTTAALSGVLNEASILKKPVVGFARSHVTAAIPAQLAVEPSAAALGKLAAARVMGLLPGAAAQAETETFAEPLLMGNVRAMRAVGLPIGNAVLEKLDEAIR